MHIIFSPKADFFSFNNVVSVGFSSPRKRSQLGHYWPYKLQPRRGSLCCLSVDFGKRLGRQRYENGRLSNVFLLEWDVFVVGRKDVLVVRLRFHCWGRYSKQTPSTCLSEHLTLWNHQTLNVRLHLVPRICLSKSDGGAENGAEDIDV